MNLPRPKTIVVVDDDPAVCSSLKFSLELEGFSVRAYGSGPELLEAGELDDCDCFVVDQRMPGLLGMDLIARLRSQEILTPAILLVSNPAGAALSSRAAKGGIAIVEKPLLGNALVDTIRHACQHG